MNRFMKFMFSFTYTRTGCIIVIIRNSIRKDSSMKKHSSAPTMKDVAREAGVALGTVSKVVNGLKVQEEYKNRVDAAIEKLGYQVNSYAQALKTNRTHIIAFLVPNAYDPFFAMLIHHLNLSLAKRNYKMLLCCTEAKPNQEQEYISLVLQKKVDGIIGLTYNPTLTVAAGIPYVSIDRCISPDIPCVASDNFSGGQIAAEKLADLGCKHVAFLRIGSSLNNEPNKRKAGFENGCLIRGLKYEMLILDEKESTEAFRPFLLKHIKDGVLDFDGIFCVTDRIAHLIQRMLAGYGIRVPEDVQIIGFDGLRMNDKDKDDYYCSTIEQPCADIAEVCVQLVLQENNTVKPPLICLPVTYHPGGTTRE